MGLVRPPFSVADPGEPPPPPSFFTKLRPERPKHFFETGPPYSQGLDDRPPPPPLSEGLDPPMILEFATNGILALIPFKIGKLSSFLGCVP